MSSSFNGIDEPLRTPPHFYWGACFVCRATPSAAAGTTLKRCSRCNAISYCSVEHQRKHWKRHKPLCNYLAAAAAEVGADTFFAAAVEGEGTSSSEEENPWRSWRQFRVRAIQTCEAILSRSLEIWEKEMFLFPKACRVCHLAKADGMIPCETCYCVAYCSRQHQEEDAARHDGQLCANLLSSMVADNYESFVQVANPAIPTTVDSKRVAVAPDMDAHIRQMLGTEAARQRNGGEASLDLEVLFLSERLSGPMTLLNVMEKVGGTFFDAAELVIHVAGANVVDMIGIIRWEYLQHRLPECRLLRFVFVGPEFEEEEEGESPALEGANCQDCRDAGRETRYEFYSREYKSYATDAAVYRPPDLVAVFNCGFSEYKDQPAQDTWRNSLGALVQVLVAFVMQSCYDRVIFLAARRRPTRVHVLHGMRIPARLKPSTRRLGRRRRRPRGALGMPEEPVLQHEAHQRLGEGERLRCVLQQPVLLSRLNRQEMKKRKILNFAKYESHANKSHSERELNYGLLHRISSFSLNRFMCKRLLFGNDVHLRNTS